MTSHLKLWRLMPAAGLAALLGASPVFAADLVNEEPPAPAAPMEEPPVASWQGAYAGLQIGYGFSGEVKARDSDGKIDTDGVLGGAFAGYNWQSGNVVAGVEGDVGYNGMRGDESGVEAKPGVEGSLRGRLGYAVTPDILPYVTAGGAAESLKLEGGGESDRNTMLGYTVGAGMDLKVTENVFARGEYRYTDFGKEDFELGGADGSVDDQNHRVQFGVGMKF